LSELDTITTSGEDTIISTKSFSWPKELPDPSTEAQDGTLHTTTEEATPHTLLTTHTATSTGTPGTEGIDLTHDSHSHIYLNSFFLIFLTIILVFFRYESNP